MNPYTDEARVAARVNRGQARDLIGSYWDVLGPLQLRFLIDQGMEPGHRLLDVGCGCLRGGVRFLPYLDEGNYYGLDRSRSLIDAGYETELRKHGCVMDYDHLMARADFDVSSWEVSFDFAIAQSVFTHVDGPEVTRALEALRGVMAPGGRFFATYFLLVNGEPTWVGPGASLHSDPFAHDVDDVRERASAAGWVADVVGQWGHPYRTSMVEYRVAR